MEQALRNTRKEHWITGQNICFNSSHLNDRQHQQSSINNNSVWFLTSLS